MSVIQSPASQPPVRRRVGRWVGVAMSAYAVGIFAIAWLFVAAAVLTDGRLLGDAWVWLSGLEPLAALATWVLFLPIGYWLWVWQAGYEPLVMAFVLAGLVLWTLLALVSLPKAFRRT